MSRTKLDPNQIAQYEHDEVACAKKVTMVNTEMAMELSADDGDSVQIQSRTYSMTLTPGEEYNISNVSKMRLYCKTTGADPSVSEAQISPTSDSDFWINSDLSVTPGGNIGDVAASNEVSVTALRLKVSAASNVELILVAKG